MVDERYEKHNMYSEDMPEFIVVKISRFPPVRGFVLHVEAACPTREARDAAWRLLTGEGL
jgi:hypothetical protein